MTASTFIFVRHAESEGVHDILAGRKENVSLTPSGFEHARNTAAYLTHFPVTDITASPQRRAQQTAFIIAETLHLPVQTDDAFAEMDFGAWTGLPFENLNNLREWKTYNSFRSISAAPGGESLRDVQQRAIDALVKLHALKPARTSVIVTHADVIRAALAFFCGAPLDLYLRFRIDPASVSIVELSHFGAQVHCVNRLT